MPSYGLGEMSVRRHGSEGPHLREQNSFVKINCIRAALSSIKRTKYFFKNVQITFRISNYKTELI